MLIAVIAVIVSVASARASFRRDKAQREDEAVLRLIEDLTSTDTERHRALLKLVLSRGSYDDSEEPRLIESYLFLLRSIAKAGVVFDFCRDRFGDQMMEEDGMKEPGRAWKNQYLTLLWLLAEMAEDTAAIRGRFLRYNDDKYDPKGDGHFDDDARHAANLALQRVGVGPRIGLTGVEHPEGLGR